MGVCGDREPSGANANVFLEERLESWFLRIDGQSCFPCYRTLLVRDQVGVGENARATNVRVALARRRFWFLYGRRGTLVESLSIVSPRLSCSRPRPQPLAGHAREHAAFRREAAPHQSSSTAAVFTSSQPWQFG
jgi:hypothetical protein